MYFSQKKDIHIATGQFYKINKHCQTKSSAFYNQPKLVILLILRNNMEA